MTVDDIFDALYLQAKDAVGLTKLRDIVLTDESINCLSFGGKEVKPIEFIKVVRCKDCVYYTPEVDEPHKSTCQRLWGGMTECKADSYCSDGVRKDEVEE